jgi:hypothetical protein
MVGRKKISGGLSTQDYVRLGHELRDMLGRVHEYSCILPNGTEGYLLPEQETMLLWIYVSWAVQTGPQLRGGSKRPAKDELFKALHLYRLVMIKEEFSGSKTEALKRVKDELKKHSWKALEKEISPSRLRALAAAADEEEYRPYRDFLDGVKRGWERGIVPDDVFNMHNDEGPFHTYTSLVEKVLVEEQ